MIELGTFVVQGSIGTIEEAGNKRWRVQFTPFDGVPEGSDGWFTAWEKVATIINQVGGDSGPWEISYEVTNRKDRATGEIQANEYWWTIKEARLVPQGQAPQPTPTPAPQPASPIDDLFPGEVQPPMSKDVLIVRQVCLKEAINLVAADKVKLEDLYHVINVMESMVYRTYTPSREDTVEEEIA
jgi:hypothetical protein